jgi:hypothetical protein
MELALNLCWLAVVVAVYFFWLRRPHYRGRALRNSREWATAVLVLAAILVLVFPIISISDDVRAAREFLEEPAADQVLAKSPEIQKRVPLGQLATPVAALAHPEAQAGRLRALGIVYIAEPLSHDVNPLRPLCGRSPPQA